MSTKDRVIWTAKQEIGGMGPRQPTMEQLDKYMSSSGTGYGSYAAADKHTRDNWCGIFAVYCLNEGGISCYWGINPQINQWGICPLYGEIEVIYGSSGIMNGDVGVAVSQSHHFLIEEVVEEYDYVRCLEGNGSSPDAPPAWGGVLVAKGRTLGQVAWYYRIHY
jgi:hypothetical protein